MYQRQPATPHQLPADVRHFTGRESDLAGLDALLTQNTAAVVITGTAGVGKTALVVHWAHRVRQQFPDGQLYVDLFGYAPFGSEPVTPGQALEGFLLALGVSAEALPSRPEDQAALYRSLLDGRQMLVVLDNAGSPDQVRLLLPGSSSCLVVITSRSRLTGLAVREGVRRRALGLLTPTEATTLLRTIAGVARIDAESAAAKDLIGYCDHLPLALSIAAERAAAEPHTSLSELVADLADAHQRLDVLTSDDSTTAIRAVFSWSYHSLPPERKRMFRLLGLHPGPTFGAHVAAVLADLPLRQTREQLRLLKEANLIQASGHDRYLFHDLLRVYAAEQAEAEEPQRRAAIRRMLVWYLRSADAAERLLLPKQPVFPLELADALTAPVSFDAQNEALTWCEREWANLVAAVRCAEQVGEDWIAARFPRALWSYCDLRKPWSDWITTYEIGLRLVRYLRKPTVEAWITSALGVPYVDLQQFDRAVEYFTKAVTIRREIEDYEGLAGSLTNLGNTLRQQSRFDDAQQCLDEALALRRAVGDRRGEAVTLNRQSELYRDLSRLDESIDCLHRSLDIQTEIDDPHGKAFTLHNLAATYKKLGRLDDAVNAYHDSLTAHRMVHNRSGQAENLVCLGDIMVRQDKPDKAREMWQQALTILDDLNAPQAADVASRLRNLSDLCNFE